MSAYVKKFAGKVAMFSFGRKGLPGVREKIARFRAFFTCKEVFEVWQPVCNL